MANKKFDIQLKDKNENNLYPIAHVDTDGNVISSAFVKKAGDTMTGPLTLSRGSYVHSAKGTTGTAGYLQVCTLTINGVYQNHPIEIGFSRRGDICMTRLYIRFANLNGRDPDLAYFTYIGSTNLAYIVKTDTSTWDLYIRKSESYDVINIIEYHKPQYMSGTNITWTDVQVTTLPTGYTQATPSGTINHAVSSDSATKATQDGDGNTITSTYVKKSGDTINGDLVITKSSFAPLIIERSGSTYGAGIQFKNSNGSLGYIGMTDDASSLLLRYTADHSTNYQVYDTGNKPSKSDVGLGNVDNTSDINKPISTATQTALNNKVSKAGDTMTGDLYVTTNMIPRLEAMDTTHGGGVYIGFGSGHRNHGLYSTGYAETTDTWTNDGGWMVYRSSTGNVILNGNALTATKATQDGSGNTITSYYCTLSTSQTLSGAKTFTASPTSFSYTDPNLNLHNENYTMGTAPASGTTYNNTIGFYGKLEDGTNARTRIGLVRSQVANTQSSLDLMVYTPTSGSNTSYKMSLIYPTTGVPYAEVGSTTYTGSCIRNISYGTSTPSGGNSGDIYIKI